MTEFINEEGLKKLSILWYFFFMGCFFGNWAAIIPEVQEMHHLNNGELGGILACVVVGAITGITLVTQLVPKYGSAFTLRLGSILAITTFPILGIPSNIFVLIIGAMMLGLSIGFLDISVNGQAVLYEKVTSTHCLGLFTSIFAVGNIIGALLGGTMIGPIELSVFQQCLGLCGLLFVPNIFFSIKLFSYENELQIMRDFPSRGSEATDAMTTATTTATLSEPILPSISDYTESLDSTNTNIPPTKKKFSRTLIIISSLCFLAYFGEGSVGDWSAIYLDNHGASQLESSFGIAIFQLFVAIGRFYSDYLVVKIGRINLLKLSGIISASGLIIVSFAPLFLPSVNLFLIFCILGFALCGMGLSVVYPTSISIAGNCIRGMPSSDAIAFVSSVGYIGVMIGPPILGCLSLLISLRYSYLTDAVLLATMTIMAFFLKVR